MTALGNVTEIPHKRIILNDGDEVAQPLRLNVGAGGIEIPGYVSVDRKTGGEAYPLTLPDAVLDADGNKLPVASESVTEIRASHVLEHFSHLHTVHVLREFVRVLKPNGTLKIAVPDLDRCIAARAEGLPIPFEQYLMGGHVDEDDQHGALFDEHTTIALMRHVGLRNVRRWKSEVKDCASLPISLNLQGTKRGTVDTSGTVAVMTVPRYGPTETYRCVIELLQIMGIRFIQTGGAFWDKGITFAFEEALALNPKRILTIDYDSLFTHHEVEEIIWLLDHFDYDAVCPVQVQRGKNRMLVNLMGEDGQPMENPTVGQLDGEIVPLMSGHFGLTALRADALRKMPHPWFLHEPDKDGRYSDVSYDADIVFWRKFRDAGFKIGMASHVSVGHSVECAVWPDQGFRPVFQYVSDWRVSGPPVNTRR